MPKKKVELTKEQLDFMKNNRGMTTIEMAKRFGMGRNMLGKLRREAGLDRLENIDLSEEQKEFIEERCKENMSYKDIATELQKTFGINRSVSLISKIAITKGLRRNDYVDDRKLNAYQEVELFNMKMKSIMKRVKVGCRVKERNRKSKKLGIIKGEIYTVKGVYPNFIMTEEGKCIPYCDIEGIIRKKDET